MPSPSSESGDAWRDVDALHTVSELTQWHALLKGMAYCPRAVPPRSVGVPGLCSLTLFPCPFPREALERARALTPLLCEALRELCGPAALWMLDKLSACAAADPGLSGPLLRIAHELLAGPTHSAGSLVLGRSDYFVEIVHTPGSPPSAGLRQIELNTMSVGGMCTGAARGSVANYMFAMHGITYPHFPPSVQRAGPGVPELLAEMDTAGATADALAAGHRLFLSVLPDAQALGSEPPVVLMLVSADEHNVLDQHAVEASLCSRHGVRTMRLTLSQLHADAHARFDTDAHLVWVRSGRPGCTWHTVSVVYYRSCYSPAHFPRGRADWDLVLRLAQTYAVQCPSPLQHLAGCKMMQEVLSRAGVLERLLASSGAGAADQVRACFARQYALDTPDVPATAAALALARAHPDRYVLKPQAEGGGNNLWDGALAKALGPDGLGPDRLPGYVLMERIVPPHFATMATAKGKTLELPQACTELGIGFALLVDANHQIKHISETGLLFRTKHIDAREGGLTIGIAMHDWPLLLTTEDFVATTGTPAPSRTA